MKKLIIILILNIIFCSNSYAIIINLKCTGFQAYNTSSNTMDTKFKDVLHLVIDTNKNLIISMGEKTIFREWLIKDTNDSFFFSDEASDYNKPDLLNSASLNRYTGEYVAKHRRSNLKYHYICKKTNQLF